MKKGTIKKLLRQKKGLAIELAVYVMMVVVGLSMLLVSISILNKSSLDGLSNKVNERLCLDQIGESFVTAVKESQDLDLWKDSVTDYTATVSGTELILVDSLDNVKLSIKLENNGSGYKITEWKYS